MGNLVKRNMISEWFRDVFDDSIDPQVRWDAQQQSAEIYQRQNAENQALTELKQLATDFPTLTAIAKIDSGDETGAMLNKRFNQMTERLNTYTNPSGNYTYDHPNKRDVYGNPAKVMAYSQNVADGANILREHMQGFKPVLDLVQNTSYELSSTQKALNDLSKKVKTLEMPGGMTEEMSAILERLGDGVINNTIANIITNPQARQRMEDAEKKLALIHQLELKDDPTKAGLQLGERYLESKDFKIDFGDSHSSVATNIINQLKSNGIIRDVTGVGDITYEEGIKAVEMFVQGGQDDEALYLLNRMIPDGLSLESMKDIAALQKQYPSIEKQTATEFVKYRGIYKNLQKELLDVQTEHINSVRPESNRSTVALSQDFANIAGLKLGVFAGAEEDFGLIFGDDQLTKKVDASFVNLGGAYLNKWQPVRKVDASASRPIETYFKVQENALVESGKELLKTWAWAQKGTEEDIESKNILFGDKVIKYNDILTMPNEAVMEILQGESTAGLQYMLALNEEDDLKRGRLVSKRFKDMDFFQSSDIDFLGVGDELTANTTTALKGSEGNVFRKMYTHWHDRNKELQEYKSNKDAWDKIQTDADNMRQAIFGLAKKSGLFPGEIPTDAKEQVDTLGNLGLIEDGAVVNKNFKAQPKVPFPKNAAETVGSVLNSRGIQDWKKGINLSQGSREADLDQAIVVLDRINDELGLAEADLQIDDVLEGITAQEHKLKTMDRRSFKDIAKDDIKKYMPIYMRTILGILGKENFNYSAEAEHANIELVASGRDARFEGMEDVHRKAREVLQQRAIIGRYKPSDAQFRDIFQMADNEWGNVDVIKRSFEGGPADKELEILKRLRDERAALGGEEATYQSILDDKSQAERRITQLTGGDEQKLAELLALLKGGVDINPMLATGK